MGPTHNNHNFLGALKKGGQLKSPHRDHTKIKKGGGVGFLILESQSFKNRPDLTVESDFLQQHTIELKLKHKLYYHWINLSSS